MKAARAVLAGITGAISMSASFALAGAAGVRIELESLLGSAITAQVTAATWILGIFLHLAFGAAFGLIYASIFERLGVATWGRGAALGIIHALITGILLGAVPDVHPLVPQRLGAPGMFMAARGRWAVAVFFAAHALYGAVVGGLYSVVYRRAGVAAPRLVH